MAKVTCGMPDGTVKERAERSCEKFSYAPYGFNVAPLAGVLGFDGQPRDGVTGCLFARRRLPGIQPGADALQQR